MTTINVMDLLSLLGVGLFAATGALAASRKQLDVIGFAFLAAATGIGGGTVRDIILDVDVFWIREPTYVSVCVGVAVLIFFTAHLVESRYRLLLWFDAGAMAAFCVLGASKGLDATGSPVIAVVMGVFTASFGGVLRDLLANEPTVLLRREIYVTAAMTGAIIYVATELMGWPAFSSAGLAALSAFAIRVCALAFDLSLPTYRPRQARPAPDSLRVRRAPRKTKR